jgi:hypothetical protein
MTTTTTRMMMTTMTRRKGRVGLRYFAVLRAGSAEE